MLISFSTENFLSFKDRVCFSMVAASDDVLQESNVFKIQNKRLVKSAIIYGANASGKSNLINAMSFMRYLVLNSSKESQANEDIGVEPFRLHTDCEDKPSFFEIEFIKNGVTYCYGFEVDPKRVHSEWLYMNSKTKRARLFERKDNDIYVNALKFKEGQGLESRSRDNALFISVCAQWNGETARSILSWFQDLEIFRGLGPYGYGYSMTIDLLKRPEMKQRILNMIRIADLGIDDIEGLMEKVTIESLPGEMPEELKKDIVKQGVMVMELKTFHSKYGKDLKEVGKVKFDSEESESGGTQKFLQLAGPLLNVLENGSIIIIDEFDSRLHPILTKAIVELFNSSFNHTNAQLIFASHDTGLLSNKLFRRDQIWFTEKNNYGISSLYSLIELSGVRKESSFSKDYILGKYGAIPFIGDPSWLFCEANND